MGFQDFTISQFQDSKILYFLGFSSSNFKNNNK